MEAFKEKTVGFLLVAGLVICAVGIILMCAFIGGGVMHGTYTRTPVTNQITDAGDLNLLPMAFLVFVVGVGLIGGSVGFAIWQHRSRFRGARQSFPNVRVVARYGFTKNWNMISEPYEFEQAENPHYFVRLEVTPGELREFECAPEIYFACGEGMLGDAQSQGKWLGHFMPHVGVRLE